MSLIRGGKNLHPVTPRQFLTVGQNVSVGRNVIIYGEMPGVVLDRYKVSTFHNVTISINWIKNTVRSIGVEISLGRSVDGRSVKAPINISMTVRWYAKTSALPCCGKY
jgi:hypothetical protein